MDFTGGIPEIIHLTANSEKEKKALFKALSKAMRTSGFLSSSLSGMGGMGLTARHAYSITKFLELPLDGRHSVRLVRVRNPHGNEDEWRGEWSDKDRSWDRVSAKDKRDNDIQAKNDGEFYMAFEDFIRYYGEVEVVHVKPESMHGDVKEKWEVFGFNNKWEGQTAGGCGNDSIGC